MEDEDNVFEVLFGDAGPAYRWAFALVLAVVLILLMPLLEANWKLREAYRWWVGE